MHLNQLSETSCRLFLEGQARDDHKILIFVGALLYEAIK